MSFKYDTNEEVTVTKCSGYKEGAFEYSHPSYGMIHVSRRQGTPSGLFGSDIDHGHFMSLTISEATCTQDLGRNWFHDTKVITEVVMSSVQYAEMISNPNTQGVPCTIKYTRGKGSIRYEPMTKIVDQIEEEIKEQFTQTKKDNKEVVGKVKEIFNKKSLNKQDKEAILRMIEQLSLKITSSIPFYEESIKEQLDKTKLEAKQEVESYITHAITKAGIAALNNPAAMQLLLEDK